MIRGDRTCPICGEPMRCYGNRNEIDLLESSKECQKGHYFYQYAHGFISVVVGNRAWDWTYLDSPASIKARTKEIQEAITKLKETYDKT